MSTSPPHLSTCVMLQAVLSGSLVLAGVSDHARAAFIRALTAEWLPGKAFRLLYRGSRDRMTPDAFHAKCDGKGPTLTLIRSDNKCVFGGYASVSWRSCLPREVMHCSDAFLFSVASPSVGGAVRCPVLPSEADYALGHSAQHGPDFNGLVLHGQFGRGDAFDRSCSADIGASYMNTLGRRHDVALAGSYRFTPDEVEVYAVR